MRPTDQTAIEETVTYSSGRVRAMPGFTGSCGEASESSPRQNNGGGQRGQRLEVSLGGTDKVKQAG